MVVPSMDRNCYVQTVQSLFARYSGTEGCGTAYLQAFDSGAIYGQNLVRAAGTVYIHYPGARSCMRYSIYLQAFDGRATYGQKLFCAAGIVFIQALGACGAVYFQALDGDAIYGQKLVRADCRRYSLYSGAHACGTVYLARRSMVVPSIDIN